MKTEELVSILKQGAESWNQWRREAPFSGELVLRGTNLRELNLVGVNLSWVNLRESNLCDSDLSGADLTRANLGEAHLGRTNLERANLSGAILYSTDFSETKLSQANLSGAGVGGALFRGTDLSMADLSRAQLTLANFGQANLEGADLRGSELWTATFSLSRLRGADLEDAHVGFTVFAGVDLSEVKGLEGVRHGGPSTIGIDTICLSNGGIPEGFLRGAGVPEEFVDLAKSSGGRRRGLYSSCFLSYSSQDVEFMRLLRSDLLKKRVDCFWCEEDLRIGESFWDRIAVEIENRGKTLVVVSDASVRSPNVEREVRLARSREDRTGRKDVLFPICIDAAWENDRREWVLSLHEARHFGRFTDWREDSSYQKALGLLLRDLRAGASPAST